MWYTGFAQGECLSLGSSDLVLHYSINQYVVDGGDAMAALSWDTN